MKTVVFTTDLEAFASLAQVCNVLINGGEMSGPGRAILGIDRFQTAMGNALRVHGDWEEADDVTIQVEGYGSFKITESELAGAGVVTALFTGQLNPTELNIVAAFYNAASFLVKASDYIKENKLTENKPPNSTLVTYTIKAPEHTLGEMFDA